jgi:glycosyltransferase involved in cell wall biosynthesis
MRDISQAQVESGRYSAVAMGVIASSKWPAIYSEAFARLDLPRFGCKTVNIFGTAKFLWQIFQRPPVGLWADELMQRSGADMTVIHIHNAWMSGVYFPLRTANPDRVKSVVTFHGVCMTLEQQPVRRWLHRQMAYRLMRYGAKLTSVDVGNLPLAEKVFRIPPRRFTVVPNGVRNDQTLNAAKWLGTGELVIGYVGLLAEHKGWQIIAQAVLKVRAAGRKVRLVIAGSGPQADLAHSLSREHSEAIEFLGHISDPRRNLMPRLHVLSLMSTYEGLPMVLLEAASVGLPMVATAVGGVREILEDDVTGRVVLRSVDCLAQTIEDLYEHPEILSRMGQAARSVYTARFELDKVVELYHGVYTS